MAIPLPDLRDGLTPWSRLMLSRLREGGATAEGDFLKTVKVLSPIKDSNPQAAMPELYVTLLRLARAWVCRYPLIENQGNIGTIDGDPPAGMRYNEMRLTAFGESMLAPNNADLPAAGPFPHLLCNGAWAHGGSVTTQLTWDAKASGSGNYGPVDYVPLDEWIGGSVESFFPSHNLGEVSKALIHLVDHPRSGLDEILKIVPGPDFPTGGTCIADDSLKALYETGSGCLRVRGEARSAPGIRGRKLLIISEIPYATSKAEVLEQLAGRAKSGEFGWLSDVRDMSSREQIAVELEVRKGYDEDRLLKEILGTRALERSLEFRLIGVESGRRRQVGFLSLLNRFLEHRREQLGARRSDGGDEALKRELSSWLAQADPRRTRIVATP